ncbi:MAG: SWIM zinc finger domain-containing protein [Ktedonobacteraceae bacterium]
MITIPKLSERDIRAFVSEQNLVNGKQYVRNGAIFDARQHGTTLRASCRGSEGAIYKVQVTFDGADIDESFCTCPAANHAYCKHIAALLWAWHEHPENFTEMDKVGAELMELDKIELISLMQQMMQLHPDLEGLIETISPADTTTTQQKSRVPFNPELYRRQVAEVFYNTDRDSWGSEGRAAEPLLRIKAIADGFAQQRNYKDAATIYEIIISNIIDEYDSFRWHADEGDLDDVVEDCVEALGVCLKEDRDDAELRQRIIQTLYTVYKFDEGLYNDMPVMSDEVPTLLIRYTTPEERQSLAALHRQTFDYDVDWHTDDISEGDDFDRLLLGLEADTIDDETFLRISRETESYDYLVERLLKLGRLDEALEAARQAESYDVLEIADILSEHGHDAIAEQMVRQRVEKFDDTELLEWLKDRYVGRGDIATALAMANRIIRVYPHSATIEQFQEIRNLAEQLKQWDAVRTELLAFFQKSQNTSLLIEIALDEDQVDTAIELLQSEQRPSGSVAIDVARAAEESRPLKALEIYTQYIARLIEGRGRGNYNQACEYLKDVRSIYQKLGKQDLWANYIAELRERNKNLPALKDEMVKAKL